MDIHELTKSAGLLKSLDKKHSKEYSEKKEALSAEMNQRLLSRKDIHDLVGDNNAEILKDNNANHLRFMESMFTSYDPDIMVNTILWVFRAYRSRGFSTTFWSALMNTWISVLKENLSEESFNAILPYYEWMQVNIPSFVSITTEQLKDSSLRP